VVEAVAPSEWLAIAEAARVTGWNPERLRSLARRGTITSRRGNRGLEILVENGRPRSVDGRPQPDGRPATATVAVDPHGEHQAWLEATIDRLREDLARAEHNLGGLRVELARAEERARAIEAVARGDVEAAKRVVEAELAAKDEVLRELRAQVAREIDRAAAIAVQLVESRRPWWRRLLT
jgi:hypothetical protein